MKFSNSVLSLLTLITSSPFDLLFSSSIKDNQQSSSFSSSLFANAATIARLSQIRILKTVDSGGSETWSIEGGSFAVNGYTYYADDLTLKNLGGGPCTPQSPHYVGSTGFYWCNFYHYGIREGLEFCLEDGNSNGVNQYDFQNLEIGVTGDGSKNPSWNFAYTDNNFSTKLGSDNSISNRRYFTRQGSTGRTARIYMTYESVAGTCAQYNFMIGDAPSVAPSMAPSLSNVPTMAPSVSNEPSISYVPSVSIAPSSPPSVSYAPSSAPSPAPSAMPSNAPTKIETLQSNHVNGDCYYVSFYTDTVIGSGSAGAFYIPHFGYVPDECKSSPGASCKLGPICPYVPNSGDVPTFDLIAMTSDDWAFQANTFVLEQGVVDTPNCPSTNTETGTTQNVITMSNTNNVYWSRFSLLDSAETTNDPLYCADVTFTTGTDQNAESTGPFMFAGGSTVDLSCMSTPGGSCTQTICSYHLNSDSGIDMAVIAATANGWQFVAQSNFGISQTTCASVPSDCSSSTILQGHMGSGTATNDPAWMDNDQLDYFALYSVGLAS